MTIRDRPRRGFSLIEMLAVIGLVGLIITMAAVTIQGLMAASRSARSEWAETAALERLATTFRDDVHQARKAPAIAQADRLAIDQGDGRSVEYHLNSGSVVVTRTRPGLEKPTVETHKARKWRAERIEREPSAVGALVRLVFQPVGRAGSIELPIEAVAGSAEVTP